MAFLSGGWLVEDPYRHWQFGFRSRGVTDCLVIRWASGSVLQGRLVLKRTIVGHCQGLRHVGQKATFPRCDRSKCPLRHLHIKKDAHLTRTGVRQGDNLGPGLVRRSHDAATQERVEWAVGCATVGSSSCGTILINGTAWNFHRCGWLGPRHRCKESHKAWHCFGKPCSSTPSYESDCSTAYCGSQLHERLQSGLHWSMAGARTHQLAGNGQLKAQP